MYATHIKYFLFLFWYCLLFTTNGKTVHRGLTEGIVITITYLYAKKYVLERFDVALAWICLERSISFFVLTEEERFLLTRFLTPISLIV